MSVVTTEMQDQVAELYITYFGRAPDAEGFAFWTQALANGASVMDIGADFAKSPEFQQAYGGLTPEEQVNSFYQNTLNRDADAGGLEYWSNLLKNGASFTSVAYAIVNTAFEGGAGVAESDTALVRNKVTIGKYFAIDLQSNDFAAASSAFESVTADPDSVTATEARLDAEVEGGTVFNLTTGKDSLVGNSQDNTFVARVVQNGLGEQVNELASGDSINGGGGSNTLFAKVQAASTAEGTNGRINPETVAVQTVHLEAVSSLSLGSTPVLLDAGDMLGLTEIGSVESDVSLNVYDLTTLTDNGLYADRRDESDITIRMDHTGNGNTIDEASSLRVYFDQNYISQENLTTSQARWFLIDQDSPDGQPLLSINVDGIVGTIDGERFVIENPALGGQNNTEFDTWQEFVAALQDPLQALIDAGTLPAGTTLTLDESVTDFTFMDDGTLSPPIPAITLTLADSTRVLDAIGFEQMEEEIGPYNVYGNVDNSQTGGTTLSQSTIVLDKVGRGSDGGELVVGGMSNDGDNVWDAGSGSKGIQRFNVTVEGDATQPSDLASLRSTHNTLEEVVVVGTGGASLTIGNSNTVANTSANTPNQDPTTTNPVGLTTAVNNALKDVRLFNASGLEALLGAPSVPSVEVHAYLSDEVVAKYMDLTDGQTAAAADNADFVYTLTGGNDTLNINLSKDNLAASGTATREDFTFTANGDAGDDTILVQIGDGVGTAQEVNENWFVNTVQNDNLVINGGDGNDTIWTWGAGAFTINAGAGNDLVMTDNSGAQEGIDFNEGRATFVFNVDPLEINIDDLQSEPRTDTDSNVAQTTVTVSFLGIEAEAIVGETSALRGGDVNDLLVRQAIKNAINNDEHLSDILVAEDGPSGALVVRSLIDGQYETTDLSIEITSALTEAQEQVSVDPATVLGGDLANALTNRFETTLLAQEGDVDITGADSEQSANNNTISDGTGADTIVFSSAVLVDGQALELSVDEELDVIVNYAGDATGVTWAGSPEVLYTEVNGGTMATINGIEEAFFAGNTNFVA